MLEKLDRVKGPEDVWARAERVSFRFADAPRSGDIVLEAFGLGAARGGRTLFSDVSLLVRRGEKLGVVGPNGSGKTTLLRILAGKDRPEPGELKRGANLHDGYFDQHLGSLDDSLSAIEEIRRIRGDLTVEAVREYLARFRFYGDDPFRKVASFSGGERSRLALAKLLLEPRNALFLDEPTNHLDIFAAEILEEALVGFEGTVVLVSHDRRFLENVTTRVVAFTDAGVESFAAGFSDYEAALARAREETREAERRNESERREPKRTEPKPASEGRDGAQSHEARRAAARDIEKKRRLAEKLERDVSETETKLGELRERLRAAPGDNWEKLHELSREEQVLARRIDALMKDWERVSEELARIDAAGRSVAEEATR
jgi:ATP-binding cassette subfamily F protein 3